MQAQCNYVKVNSTMAGDEGESYEELLNLLHRRLMSTGEWSVLLGQLRNMLEEEGWDARLREHAESAQLADQKKRWRIPRSTYPRSLQNLRHMHRVSYH